MSYDINYSKLSQEEGDAKALRDAEFFNSDGLEKIEAFIADGTLSNFYQVRLAMSFAGIQGRPVLALCRKHGIEIPYKDEDGN